MAVILALTLLAGRDDPTPIPVVLTTDFGVEVDDQWALTHLALSPRIELRAVVTTHAPGLDPARAAQAARAWLDALPLVHKPDVLAGSARALENRTTPRPNAGVDRIVSESKRAPGTPRLVVLAIGAATDLASALLTDPTLADRIEVVAMGFSRWPEGGDPWNVKNDVRAWQVLLDARVSLVVGDEAVCKRNLGMTPDRARRRFETSGAPGKAMIGVLESWVKARREQIQKTTGNPDEWPIWDEVTVAHLLGLTRVETHPRPKLRDDMTFDHAQPSGTIGWIGSVNSEGLWNDLAGCLQPTR